MKRVFYVHQGKSSKCTLWATQAAHNLRRSFGRPRRGAIAVETALLMPLVIFGFLTALDLGLQIRFKQNLTKATKSGIDVIQFGTRNTSTVQDVVQSALGKPVNLSDIQIQASCACIEAKANGDTDGANGQPAPQTASQNGAEPDQGSDYGFYYTKRPADFVVDMCKLPCPDGAAPIPLVDLQVEKTFRSLYTERHLSARLQTRLE